MKIVNCALLYADGDKYVWSVVTEGASEFPIDMELVADGSIWENDGTKSVLTDGSWVAESSGGGVSFPTFTNTNASWTCDMTYGEAKEVYDANKLGTRFANCPCKKNAFGDEGWDVMVYLLRSDIKETTVPSMPSDLVGCLNTGDVFYGNDNNFYVRSST